MIALGCAPRQRGVGPYEGVRASRRCQVVAAAGQPSGGGRQYELSICTNKTCRRQGSAQVAKFGQDLAAALPSIAVDTLRLLGLVRQWSQHGAGSLRRQRRSAAAAAPHQHAGAAGGMPGGGG